MNLLRLVIFSVGAMLMVGGYAVSQMRFFSGTTADYIQRLDESPVPFLSLGLLVVAVVLGFVPAPVDGEPEAAG